MPERLRRVGVVGCGRIGMPVLQALRDGRLPGWTLTGVLARDSRDLEGLRATASLDEFLAQAPDLVVEAAGPAALALIGARALAVADVWAVSGAALADDRVHRELDAACQSSGHRLRLVAGALAALDGVAMTSVDPQARLRLELDLPGAGQAGTLFSGTARQAALRFPDGVNVAVAAALAGPGLDQTDVVVTRPLAGHCLSVRAISRHAQVQAAVEIRSGGLHPVAACLIALLRRETQTIWAG